MLFLSGKVSPPIHRREGRGTGGPGRVQGVGAPHPASPRQLRGALLLGHKKGVKLQGHEAEAAGAVEEGGNTTLPLVDGWTV